MGIISKLQSIFLSITTFMISNQDTAQPIRNKKKTSYLLFCVRPMFNKAGNRIWWLDAVAAHDIIILYTYLSNIQHAWYIGTPSLFYRVYNKLWMCVYHLPLLYIFPVIYKAPLLITLYGHEDEERWCLSSMHLPVALPWLWLYNWSRVALLCICAYIADYYYYRNLIPSLSLFRQQTIFSSSSLCDRFVPTSYTHKKITLYAVHVYIY